ncbi:De-etiolated protein 1 Det1-domain-containing protein [Entophlyctis helioformis]|nr:De-etiolated protein 1 Det1-domain-containing protein [Entophlyctis helioformis]
MNVGGFNDDGGGDQEPPLPPFLADTQADIPARSLRPRLPRAGTSMLLPTGSSTNLQRRLAARELHSGCGGSWWTATGGDGTSSHGSRSPALDARLVYANVYPNRTAFNAGAPAFVIRKFTPDGRHLVCFGQNMHSVMLFSYAMPHRSTTAPAATATATSWRLRLAATATEDCNAAGPSLATSSSLDSSVHPSSPSPAGPFAALPSRHHLLLFEPPRPEQPSSSTTAGQAPDLSFDDVFKLKYERPITSGHEILCKDFCLFTSNKRHMILASVESASAASAPSQGRRFPTSLDCISKLDHITFWVVDVESGDVLDKKRYKNEYMYLTNHAGVHLYEDLLSITSVQNQCIYLLHVKESGRLVELNTIGYYTNDDDELVLSMQREAEKRYRRRVTEEALSSLRSLKQPSSSSSESDTDPMAGLLPQQLGATQPASDAEDMHVDDSSAGAEDDDFQVGDMQGTEPAGSQRLGRHRTRVMKPQLAYRSASEARPEASHVATVMTYLQRSARNQQHYPYMIPRGPMASAASASGIRLTGSLQARRRHRSEQFSELRNTDVPRASDVPATPIPQASPVLVAPGAPLIGRRSLQRQSRSIFGRTQPLLFAPRNVPAFAATAAERVITAAAASATALAQMDEAVASHSSTRQANGRLVVQHAQRRLHHLFTDDWVQAPFESIMQLQQSLRPTVQQPVQPPRRRVPSFPANVASVYRSLVDAEQLSTITRQQPAQQLRIQIPVQPNDLPLPTLMEPLHEPEKTLDESAAPLGGLKHRIMAYLYQQAAASSSPGALTHFYRTYGHFLSLVMWRTQFLDRHSLLIKYGSAEMAIGRGLSRPSVSSATNSAFFVIYSIREGRVVGVYENNSVDMLRMAVSWGTLFCDGSHGSEMGTWVHNNVHARESVERSMYAVCQARNGGTAQAIRRLLSTLPVGTQTHIESPYFDHDVYSFDDKSISASDRMRLLQDCPPRFYCRATGAFKFCIESGPSADASSRTQQIRFVMYVFHPTDPFVMTAEHVQGRISVLNLHYADF